MENIKVRLRPHYSFWTKPLLNYGFRKCFQLQNSHIGIYFLSQLGKSEFFLINEPNTFCTYRSWILCCEIIAWSSGEKAILNEVKQINYRVLKYVLIKPSVQISRCQFSLPTDTGIVIFTARISWHMKMKQKATKYSQTQ